MTRRAIQILHDAGMRVTILTKGGSRSLRDLDLLGPGDSYGCTLTSLGPAVSSRWEPNAAPPGDRIEALAAFHEAGVPTWVSLEPVLDPGATLEIIRRTAPVVDEFRVGKLNYRSEAEAIDWRTFGREVVRVLERLGKAYYIKKDLRAYM
jgi:DNA repair photolyase